MFTMVDPFDYTALQKLEDLLDIHCGCAVRPSEYCPVHNAKTFIDVVEKKVLGLEKELEEARAEAEEAVEKEVKEECEDAHRNKVREWSGKLNVVEEALGLPLCAGEDAFNDGLDALLEAVENLKEAKATLDKKEDLLGHIDQAERELRALRDKLTTEEES